MAFPYRWSTRAILLDKTESAAFVRLYPESLAGLSVAVYSSNTTTTIRSDPQPINHSSTVTGVEPQLMALLNHVLPNGHVSKITRAEVDALTRALSSLDELVVDHSFFVSDLAVLRDKLEALLPPEDLTNAAP